MTVAELKQELDRFVADAEVVVAESVGVAYKLLGVLAVDGKVLLDPSRDSKDRMAHHIGKYYEARKLGDG